MEKAHEVKDLDLTCAARGVWLVKVPKYLSDSWKKAGPGVEVGKLQITKIPPSLKSDVLFQTNDALRNAVDPTEQAIPTEHKFSLMGIGSQNLSILSIEQLAETTDDISGAAPGIACEGRVAIAGKVIQRAECRPQHNDASYLSHIQKRIKIGNQPQQKVVQLTQVVNTYKPTSIHAADSAHEMKKKEEGKHIRGEKEKVMDMLFAAFEKYQYYNVKDLVRVTKQPITFLKEILKEICVYNMKAPNRNTWELKPEYRHYKEPAGASSSGGS